MRMSLNFLATRFQCSWPWTTLVMLCDGRIVCGCADPYGRRVLGDARAASVEQIWTGPVISTLRKELNAGGSKFCGDCALKLPLKKDDTGVLRPVTAGALPEGLTLTAAGLISGTPTTAGTFTVTIRGTAADGCLAERALTISIATAVPTLPQVFLVMLAAGLLGAGYVRLRGRARVA